MIPIYSYIRDEYKRPMITQCFLLDGDRLAVGQAFCSKKDQPNKKKGKKIALYRAVSAMNKPIETIDLKGIKGEVEVIAGHSTIGRFLKMGVIDTEWVKSRLNIVFGDV